MVWMNLLQGRNRDAENRLVGTVGEGEGGRIERVALKHRHTIPEIASRTLRETAGSSAPVPCDSFVFLISVLCWLPESQAAFASEMSTFMGLRKLNANARACDLQHSE